jgi:hypothetical protein
MLLVDQNSFFGNTAGVAFQALVIGLVLIQYGIYVNFVLLPREMDAWVLLHMTVSGTSVSLLLYSYYKSCFTNPGEVPSGWVSIEKKEKEQEKEKEKEREMRYSPV